MDSRVVSYSVMMFVRKKLPQHAHDGDPRLIYALSDRVYLSGCLTAFNFE